MDTVADLGRFVLGYQHRFDEKTKVATELEVARAYLDRCVVEHDEGELSADQMLIPDADKK